MATPWLLLAPGQPHLLFLSFKNPKAISKQQHFSHHTCLPYHATGADPSPWTVPPPAPASAGDDADEDPAAAGAEAFASYESVCSSPVYRELKELLPPSSEFAHTFALAQMLLRAPCTPLLLAVRFGRQAAARALVAAMLARDRAERWHYQQEGCSRQGSEQSEAGSSGLASPSSTGSDSTQASAQAELVEGSVAGPATPPCRPERPSSRLQWELDSALGAWSLSPEPQARHDCAGPAAPAVRFAAPCWLLPLPRELPTQAASPCVPPLLLRRACRCRCCAGCWSPAQTRCTARCVTSWLATRAAPPPVA